MSWNLSSLNREHYTYEYFLQDFVCRLCWNNNGFVKLTSYSPKSIQNDSTIAEKILESVGIDVNKHSHPNTICSSCLEKIEMFTKFKRFCHESDRKLLCIFKNESQRVKPVKVELEIDYDPIYLKKETDLQIEISLDVKKEEIDKVSLNQETDKASTNFTTDKTEAPSSGLVKDKNIHCRTCHTIFDSTEKLTQHNLEHHKNIKERCYKCYGCEKRFKNVSLRLNHEMRSCDALARGYKCDFCETYLRKRTLLKAHLKEHKKKKDVTIDDILKCSECSDTFDSLRGLKRHMFMHNKKTPKGTFVCEVCGRVFGHRGNLYNHRLTHTDVKRLKCPHCDHRATQQSSLIAHIRVHTGERPYPCDQCPQRCTTRSNLIKHRKMKHLKIKNFKCKLCEKKYGYKLSLKEHMSVVHERSETHTCTQCGSTYSRFGGLRRHILVKHGKKVKKIKEVVVEVQNEKKEATKEVVFDFKEGEVVSVVQNTDEVAFMAKT